MPAISPLMAIRYPQEQQSALVAPPYDVLSGDDKSRLLAREGHNIVAIDLPHIPPKEAGPDAAYAASAHTLQMWLESGILKREEKPALYAYQQTYSHAGTTYKRRGFFARVPLHHFLLLRLPVIYRRLETLPELKHQFTRNLPRLVVAEWALGASATRYALRPPPAQGQGTGFR